jgi:hypothetical protein
MHSASALVDRVQAKGAGAVIAVAAVLAAAAPAVLGAAGGSYTGRTTQGHSVTFKLSGGKVRNFKILIDDTCPDRHTLAVTARYPLMPVTGGRFGGAFVPVHGHRGAHATLTGKVGILKVTGTLHDTSYSKQERTLCQGHTRFTARRA